MMQWHADNAGWLLRHLAKTPAYADTRLVVPTAGFFKTDARKGHEFAEAIFAQIKAYAGMSEWPVHLVSDVEVYEPHGDLVQAPSRHTPLGMFFRGGGEDVQISYAPELLKNSVNLIATLAHELAHYLIHAIDDDLPCAPEEEEFFTDQTACFLAFGVFMANSAFSFEQWRDNGAGTQGWRSRRSGSMPVPPWIV